MESSAICRRCETRSPSYLDPNTHPARVEVHEQAHSTWAPAAHGKGRAAMLWGVGSTVLSILGFLGWGLFEQYNSSLAELRSDLKHFNETSSTFVKRDSMQRFREQAKENFKEVQAISALKARLESELRASEKARDDLNRDMQRLRERLAFVEGQHIPLPRPMPEADRTRQ